MKKTTTMAVAVLIGAGLMGCEVDEREQEAPPAAEQDPMADQAPAVGAEEDDAATIGVDSLAGTGPYLTDGEGRALYALEGESGESTCYDECAEEWPPFVATGAQAAGAAGEVRTDLLGTLERRNGESQVTYDGLPLYYYHDDQGPGDTEGHHVMDAWGEWYLVRPDGELLEGDEGNEG